MNNTVYIIAPTHQEFLVMKEKRIKEFPQSPSVFYWIDPEQPDCWKGLNFTYDHIIWSRCYDNIAALVHEIYKYR